MRKSAVEKLEDRFEDAVNDGVRALKSTERRVAARTEDALGRVVEMSHEAGEQARAVGERAVKAVRQRPLVSAGVLAIVATAVGFLLGRGSRRK
jgi:ElaB/YqjD/DUF883 family membrane-anchored ribosome-binding protein